MLLILDLNSVRGANRATQLPILPNVQSAAAGLSIITSF
jgi:hypothetical protein